MNPQRLAIIDDSKWEKPLVPTKRNLSEEDPLIIGFDTEFVSRPGEEQTLSLQFYTKNQGKVFLLGNEVLNKDSFFKYIRRFLKRKILPKKIFLVSHFSQAELSQFEDMDDLNLEPTSRGLRSHWEYEDIRFKVLDTRDFFESKLEKIGEWLKPKVSKISLEGIDLKSEDYWKNHMDEFLKRHKRQFIQYALRDAEIVYKAFTMLRDRIKNEKEYEVDILHYPTKASTSLQIFRYKVLKEPVVPVRIRTTLRSRKDKKTGDWKQSPENLLIFDGDKNVRLMALNAYYGGRNEAYVRGLIKGDYDYYDVDSLYPSASMLQPLPLQDTKWSPIQECFLGIPLTHAFRLQAVLKFNGDLFAVFSEGKDIVIKRKENLAAVMEVMFSLDSTHIKGKEIFTKIIQEKLNRYDEVLVYNPQQPLLVQTSNKNFLSNLEGFVEVDFKFPENCQYPCIPFEHERKIFFPIQGKSFCTLSEVRTAFKFGAEIRILQGCGFRTRQSERQHPLKSYLMPLLQKKQHTDKDDPDYMLYKILMNAIIGKFCQRTTSNHKEFSMLQGADEITREQYRKFRPTRKSMETVGSGWSPEWASLILGKSRSLMAELIAKGSLMVSTDSVVLPKDTDIECESLKELKSVGSNLKREYELNEILLIRSRTYILYPRDSSKKPKVARHSTSLSEEDFYQMLQTARQGNPFTGEYVEKRIVGFKEWLTTGKRLNTNLNTKKKFKLDWDGKRILTNPDVNPLFEFSDTKPHDDLRIEVTPGRPKEPIDEKELHQVRGFREQGLSWRQIGKMTGRKPETLRKRYRPLL